MCRSCIMQLTIKFEFFAPFFKTLLNLSDDPAKTKILMKMKRRTQRFQQHVLTLPAPFASLLPLAFLRSSREHACKVKNCGLKEFCISCGKRYTPFLFLFLALLFPNLLFHHSFSFAHLERLLSQHFFDQTKGNIRGQQNFSFFFVFSIVEVASEGGVENQVPCTEIFF